MGEQERQGRLEEGFGPGEEGLRQERPQEVGRRSEGRAEGPWFDWLRRDRRKVGGREGAVRQGQVVALIRKVVFCLAGDGARSQRCRPSCRPSWLPHEGWLGSISSIGKACCQS